MEAAQADVVLQAKWLRMAAHLVPPLAEDLVAEWVHIRYAQNKRRTPQLAHSVAELSPSTMVHEGSWCDFRDGQEGGGAKGNGTSKDRSSLPSRRSRRK